MLAAYRLLTSAAAHVPFPSRVFRDSRAARRGAAARWRAWARDARGPGPVIWAHGASIGEHQVLEPVLRRLARARADLRIVLSHTSPSVPSTDLPPAVCQRDYLPWDRRTDVAVAVNAVRPALALLARSDLWPEFVLALVARDIPVAVVGATMRATSGRLGMTARAVLRPVYQHITWLGAVTAGHAARWRRAGVPDDHIVVTGDPRHDRILERIPELTPATTVRSWAGGGPVLVAGSVEPSDDAVLARALPALHEAIPDLRVVIAPHDPTPQRLDALHRRLLAVGSRVELWATSTADRLDAGTRVAIVTTRGRLADLYLGAEVAYVGGGFRAGRLHAVAEPAAIGVPVVVGPRWRGTADAVRMVAGGGALPVASHRELSGAVSSLLSDSAERQRTGLRARAVLGKGAAQASADAVLRLLDPICAG